MGKEANKSHRTTPKTWKKSKVNQQDMRLEDDHTALQRSHTFKPSRRSARNRVSPSLRMAKLKDKTDKSLIRDHSFDASDADADADDDVLQLTDTDKSERLFDFNSDDVSDNEELFNQREFHALKKVSSASSRYAFFLINFNRRTLLKLESKIFCLISQILPDGETGGSGLFGP